MMIVSHDRMQAVNTYHLTRIYLSGVHYYEGDSRFRILAETSMGVETEIATYGSREAAQDAFNRIMDSFRDRERLVVLPDAVKEYFPALDSIGLSLRAFRALHKAGITSLKGLTLEKLKKVRGLGAVTIREIAEKAAEHGVDIR